MSKGSDIINQALLQNTGGLAQNLADSFIDLMREESVLLKEVRLWRVTERTGEVSKLDFSGHATEQASENTTSTETRRPTSTFLTYTTKKTRSQFDLTAEVVEDNIEGASGAQTILNVMLKSIRNSMETLGIEGDESNASTDDFSRLQKTNDGWNILTNQANGGRIKSAGAKRVSWELLRQMLVDLPTRYWQDRTALRWIGSPLVLLDLQAEAEGKDTNLGDLMWSSATGPPAPLGIPFLEVPLMPTNLSVTGTDSTGTILWLCDPKNFIYVVQRDMVVHQEFIPRFDRTEITAFMRTDFLVENADAVVKATNLVLDPGADRFT